VNVTAFDALIDRLDAEIALGPLPKIGSWQPEIQPLDHQAALRAVQANPCPPRPPEPPPAAPQRSWLGRLLFRRTR
jgi:hypothetical protein